MNFSRHAVSRGITKKRTNYSHGLVRIRENLESIIPRKLDGFYAELSPVIDVVAEASDIIPWGEMKRLL